MVNKKQDESSRNEPSPPSSETLQQIHTLQTRVDELMQSLSHNQEEMATVSATHVQEMQQQEVINVDHNLSYTLQFV